MPFATGPWHTPPELPDESAATCLVLVGHRHWGTQHHVMRYAQGGWWFEDGSEPGADDRVVKWAYITDSIERMSQAPVHAPLPPESKLFAHGHITTHENVRLLTAYIAELKTENKALAERLRQRPSPPVPTDRPETLALVKRLEQDADQLRRMLQQLKSAAEKNDAKWRNKVTAMNNELRALRATVNKVRQFSR